MAITITELADKKIFDIMKKSSSEEYFLRISLRSGGCSGFSYDFSFVEEAGDGDRVFLFERIKVCIDKKSYLFLIGMEIDYEETLVKSGIVLNNPNAKRACGCGESISF